MKKALTFLLPAVLSISLFASHDIKENIAGASDKSRQDTSRVYTVSEGDNLRSIAKKLYGDAEKWEVIFEANRGIKYADMIKPGTKLTIPALNSRPRIAQKTERQASAEAFKKLEGPDKHIKNISLADKDLFQSQVSRHRKELKNEIAGAIAPGARKAPLLAFARKQGGGIVWTEMRKEYVECVDHCGKNLKNSITYYQNSIGMKFVYINPLDKAPFSDIIKLGFYISATEVTQRQWKDVIGSDPSSRYFEGLNLPVDSVTWDNAREFCEKLSRKEGLKYRLPTEAEWEYACRAKTTTKYYCGDTISAELANFRPSHGAKPVGSYPANMWGIYDMHGNVSEWCKDEYKLGQRIMRGGSYRSYKKDLESGNRGYSSPYDRSVGNGFRVVVEIE